MPIVYGELRRLAASYLRRQRTDHTLQPTSLVNEAFLRLLGASRVRPHDRVHFFAFAARAMRQVLVDHARRKHASKREAEGEPISLEVAGDLAAPQSEVDLLALNEALDRLAAIDERQARVVELRYFSGLSAEETAEVLGVSLSSVIRDWRVARLFLHRELSR